MKTEINTHRFKKRTREIALTRKAISSALFERDSQNSSKKFNILEFGCGDGFQLHELSKIGNVTASDLYKSHEINTKEITFVECDISDTPFTNNYFDVIYSNHVIEHIEDTANAFKEIMRIGKDDCLYAFSVPTSLWLLLSVPAQYYSKFSSLLAMLKKIFRLKQRTDHNTESKIAKKDPNTGLQYLITKLLPKGHGVIEKFWPCYNQFKIDSWKIFFLDNGFEIIETKPLLLYAPSEFPVIPTVNSVCGKCSSVLFLMNKK